MRGFYRVIKGQREQIEGQTPRSRQAAPARPPGGWPAVHFGDGFAIIIQSATSPAPAMVGDAAGLKPDFHAIEARYAYQRGIFPNMRDSFCALQIGCGTT
jgi:hypothetical protein